MALFDGDLEKKVVAVAVVVVASIILAEKAIDLERE